MPKLKKMRGFVQVMTASFLVLMTLQLTGVIGVPWLVVFAPVMLSGGLLLFGVTFFAAMAYAVMVNERAHKEQSAEFWEDMTSAKDHLAAHAERSS